MADRIIRKRGVRWNKETECFEMWCPRCEEKGNTTTFWPLTHEYWPERGGLTICKACRAEMKRWAERTRRTEKRDEINAKLRQYYYDNHSLLRWKQNQYKETLRAEKAALQGRTP